MVVVAVGTMGATATAVVADDSDEDDELLESEWKFLACSWFVAWMS
jgi:hypothetical protein